MYTQSTERSVKKVTEAASAVVGIELISIEELSTTVLELFDFQKVSS